MKIPRQILAFTLALAACSKQELSRAATPPETTSYTITGSVIVADPERGTLMVKYNAVPGITEAGAADFRADDATIAAARPGVRFTARVVKKRGAKWLEDLRSGTP